MRIQSFINGVMVGMVLGLLFAPEAGEDTRRRIASKASRIKNKIGDTYEDINDTINTKADKVKTKVNSFMNKAEDGIAEFEEDRANPYNV